MSEIKDTATQKNLWSQRYQEQRTGWDIGYPSTPLKMYIDQLDDKAIKILIPGAGNAYEAEYLYRNGFKNVYILDIAPDPLVAFYKRFQHQNFRYIYFDVEIEIGVKLEHY